MSIDLTEVYRSLDPLAPLEPDSELYVERSDNPMDRVAVELKLSDRPKHYLLAGHRGTGKTTELRRLAHALAGDREVFMVDVGEASELADGSESVLADALALSLNRSIEPRAPGMNPHAPATSPLRLASEWLGALPRRHLPRRHLPRAAETLRNASDSGIPIVVVFDGLERFQRDEDILRALSRPAPVYAWPMSVICTLPLSLYLSRDLGEYARHFERAIFLPGIADDRGFASIIRRRAGEGAFEPPALRTLVRHSAGIHRELLQLAQRACVVAALGGAARVSLAHAEAAVAEQRNEYSIVLRTRDYPLLAEVMETKQLRGGDDIARLIRNQLIVAYANGTTWFDVHPILRPLLERKVPS